MFRVCKDITRNVSKEHKEYVPKIEVIQGICFGLYIINMKSDITCINGSTQEECKEDHILFISQIDQYQFESPHLLGWWKVMAFSLPTMGPHPSSMDLVVDNSKPDTGRLLFPSRESSFLSLLAAWVFLCISCVAGPCVPRSCHNSQVLQRGPTLWAIPHV